MGSKCSVSKFVQECLLIVHFEHNLCSQCSVSKSGRNDDYSAFQAPMVVKMQCKHKCGEMILASPFEQTCEGMFAYSAFRAQLVSAVQCMQKCEE